MTIVEDRRSGLDTRAQDLVEVQGERRNESDRRALRRRVIKGVRLSFNNEYCAVEGVMKNISETGAFIKLKDGFLVPDNVVVHNDLEGYKIPAEVVRRHSDQIGVRFTGPAEKTDQSRAQILKMIDINAPATDDLTDGDFHNDRMIRQAASAQRSKPVFGKRGSLS